MTDLRTIFHSRGDHVSDHLALHNRYNAEAVYVTDYGAAGDGVADDITAIQSAVDSSAGEVVFPNGTFKISSTIICKENKSIRLSPGTIISPSVDCDIFSCRPGAHIRGGTIDVSVVTYTSDVFDIDGIYGFDTAVPTRIQEIQLVSKKVSGNGCGIGFNIHADQSNAQISYVFALIVDNIGIKTFQYGIKMTCAELADCTNWANINANIFSNIVFFSCDENLYLNAHRTAGSTLIAIVGNTFSNIQVQCSTNTNGVVYMDNAERNSIINLEYYDFVRPGASLAVELASDTLANYIDHVLYAYNYHDLGTQNTVEWEYEGYATSQLLVPMGNATELSHCGTQDDILAYADKRYIVTQEAGSVPVAGALASLFRPTVSTVRWDITSTLPVVIQVDFDGAIYNLSAIGISFADYYATSVKMEAYNSTLVGWQTLFNTTGNSRRVVTGNIKNVPVRTAFLGAVTKIRITLDGLYEGHIKVDHIFAFRGGVEGHSWMSRGGGTIYGDISFIAAVGPTLIAPDSTIHRIKVGNDGTLSTEVV